MKEETITFQEKFWFGEGISHERKRIIDRLKAQVCFDALEDHVAVAEARKIHPTLVGRCGHHGGKCTDILMLVAELEGEDNE